MRNKAVLGILLLVFVGGMTFVFFPRTIPVVDKDPCLMIFHQYEKGKETVEIDLADGDEISEEIQRFLAENRTGWRIIIRQLSLGETAPSIGIYGEDDSYKLSVWRNEAVLGFWKTEKSYRKKINPEFHARLVALINENNFPADTILSRGAEGSSGSESSNR